MATTDCALPLAMRKTWPRRSDASLRTRPRRSGCDEPRERRLIGILPLRPTMRCSWPSTRRPLTDTCGAICTRCMPYRRRETTEDRSNRIMLIVTDPAISDRLPDRHDLPPAETNFYSAYDWCLDPHLTVGEAIERLADEIDRLATIPAGWQTNEVTTNVYLLSCSLLNGIDEYLRGHTLRLPAQLAKARLGRTALWVTEKVAENFRKHNRTQVFRWKERLQDSLDGFFAVLARRDCDPASFAESAGNLSAMLQSKFPSSLLAARLSVPSAFSRLDLTHVDVLELGREFMRQYPDRSHPILLAGLRTAGTYFSALLRSFLKAEGYQQVASLTVQPKKGPSRRERKELTSY